MFSTTTPSCKDYTLCSKRNKCNQCIGTCTSTSTCQPTPVCNSIKGCPCQTQCKKCTPINCSTQPCNSKKCKCHVTSECGCNINPKKLCRKRCAPEGKYPKCPVEVRLPQELSRRKCCPSIDVFLSRIGMGDVVLSLTPAPTGAYTLKPLTLRQQSKCVQTPKINPCPKKPCKCKCGN